MLFEQRLKYSLSVDKLLQIVTVKGFPLKNTKYENVRYGVQDQNRELRQIHLTALKKDVDSILWIYLKHVQPKEYF